MSQPTSAPMIALERVSRWHGQVIGLNDVSFQLPAGLTALLGPNGAGKSTLLKLVTGQLKPHTGRVIAMGMEPFANPTLASHLGYCPEIDNFYEELTGREFVTLLAAMNGIQGATAKKRIQEVMEQVGMADRCDRRIGGYSKGMRQRIKVAQAIVHDPDILVMDEPLNGLDPVGRREMVELMQSFAARGKCVLVSSHILYEVEQITDRILVIFKGRVLAQGNIHDIRDQIDKHPHHIRIITDRPRELAANLIFQPFVLSARVDPKDEKLIEVETHQPDIFYGALPKIALAGNFQIERFHSPDNNLEAVFRYLVGDA
ncbi:ABC transporter ATP-binding protein [Armatimonas rosea]|uniref:ABC-2 type transport system ATP-binding protein n=1 Tax=Armatimonas rosea TaxID=685828 RepID=A0A7W9W5G6_ARMRO|nr:ABC transporter ATP-binding protein [Armatimonas rosea]MBB6049548.1 ABC-2 type transport system ATP-binding protein [Armatimonas rosea]